MKPDTRSFYELAVLRAVEGIVQRLDDALDLDALAGEACLSPFHLHRIFRGMVGETPLTMHRRLRLERAAWSLRCDDRPVTRIAFDAGYETHEAFTRAFRARYGVAPTEFRTMARDDSDECIRRTQTELATPSRVHWGPGAPSRIVLPPISEVSPMDVTIVERPALRAAAVHHIGPYMRISEAFARLHAIAAPSGLLRPGAQMIGVFHDDPETVPEDQLRSEAALTIAADVPVPKGLTPLALPAGRYARAVHVGPYQGLGDAWARLMGGWLPRSGHRVGEGLPYEVYVNDPTNTKPEELRTEMYVPIA